MSPIHRTHSILHMAHSTLRNTVNSVSDQVQGAGSAASKETNKSTFHLFMIKIYL